MGTTGIDLFMEDAEQRGPGVENGSEWSNGTVHFDRIGPTEKIGGALTIWMEFSVIPGRIQMERFIPVESFRKKGNTFRGISFFSVLPEFSKISVPFVHSYSARLFTVILPRKNA